MVKPLHEMAGKVISKGACISCGKPVSIKANKNGIGYYYCRWPDAETGEPCNDQHRYPRKTSARMIAEMNKTKEHDNDDRDERTTERETNFLGL